MIEEMCASYWRQRRAWAIETASLDNQIALQPAVNNADRMATAFDTLAAAPSLPLLHRYETRLHLMYQRALRTLIMLRTVKLPNEPSPISEHPPAAPQPADSEPLSGAANPGCSRLSAGSRPNPTTAPATSQVPNRTPPIPPRRHVQRNPEAPPEPPISPSFRPRSQAGPHRGDGRPRWLPGYCRLSACRARRRRATVVAMLRSTATKTFAGEAARDTAGHGPAPRNLFVGARVIICERSAAAVRISYLHRRNR
jgi:hypothetical protein